MKGITKKSEWFLIIGLSIGITIFSLGVSYVNGMKNMNALCNIKPEDFIEMNISSMRNIQEVIPKIAKNISQEQMVVTISENIDNKPVTVNGITLENDYFLNGISKSSLKDKDEIIIGKGLEKYSITEDGEDYIILDGAKYKIAGYIDNNKNNFSAYMSIDKFVEVYKEKLMPDVSFVCIKDNIDKEKIMDTIKQSLESNEEVHKIEVSNTKYTDNLLSIMSYIVLIVASINIINFTLLWISDRKKEIAIYKTFGAREVDILELLFNELAYLGIISVGISLIVQSGINYVVNKYTTINIYMSISKENVLYALAISIILSLIATIPSYIESRKIQPAIILKEE